MTALKGKAWLAKMNTAKAVKAQQRGQRSMILKLVVGGTIGFFLLGHAEILANPVHDTIMLLLGGT